jgi:hypothetical protein
MKWLKRKLINWLLKDVEVEELVVKRLRVGEGTVTIDTNSITLPGLSTDPTLAAGKLWFRSDLGTVRYSPDGLAVREILTDLHRTASPIDHPDGSVTTAKIADRAVTPRKIGVALAEGINTVNFFIVSRLDIIHHENPVSDHTITLLDIIIFDYAAIYISRDNMRMWHRNQYPTWGSGYAHEMKTGATTADHLLVKLSAGTTTTLGSEAVDLSDYHYLYGIDMSGSSIKCFRAWVEAELIASQTPRISATDTSYASGRPGIGFVRGYYPIPYAVPTIIPAFSRGVEAKAILELGVEGSGRPEDPYRPAMSKSLAEIASLTGLPDFLYQEAKKYEILKAKGFTDEEIKIVFGYVPQHQVDLDSVTWGAFEFHADKASTVIITITGDNPYKTGAIERQKAKARRVFSVPKDYIEAVNLYNQLKKDYPHWLAGKDNFAYQVLGWEFLDWFQNVDFFYGELLEHKTHYQQLKRVDPKEIERRLNELIEKLSKVTVLTDERDKHIAKAREILKKGW